MKPLKRRRKTPYVEWRLTRTALPHDPRTTARPFISVARVAPQNSLPSPKNIWTQRQLPPIKAISSFSRLKPSPQRRSRPGSSPSQNNAQLQSTSVPWILKFARIIRERARNAAWRWSQPFRFNQPLASSTPARCIRKSFAVRRALVRFAVWRWNLVTLSQTSKKTLNSFR